MLCHFQSESKQSVGGWAADFALLGGALVGRAMPQKLEGEVLYIVLPPPSLPPKGRVVGGRERGGKEVGGKTRDGGGTRERDGGGREGGWDGGG